MGDGATLGAGCLLPPSPCQPLEPPQWPRPSETLAWDRAGFPGAVKIGARGSRTDEPPAFSPYVLALPGLCPSARGPLEAHVYAHLLLPQVAQASWPGQKPVRCELPIGGGVWPLLASEPGKTKQRNNKT